MVSHVDTTIIASAMTDATVIRVLGQDARRGTVKTMANELDQNALSVKSPRCRRRALATTTPMQTTPMPRMAAYPALIAWLMGGRYLRMSQLDTAPVPAVSALDVVGSRLTVKNSTYSIGRKSRGSTSSYLLLAVQMCSRTGACPAP